MSRPRKEDMDKKIKLSITINKELDKILNEFTHVNNLSKSEYIEFLIKKDIENKKIKNN